MKNVACSFFLLVFACTFSACGYKPMRPSLSAKYRSVEVPYIQGDVDGRYTNALVRHMSSSLGLTPVASSKAADIVVKVRFIEDIEDPIGYEYDRDSTGNRSKSTVQNANRFTKVFELTMFDASSEKPLLGPVRLATSVDYDFRAGSSGTKPLDYSLGQFDTIDAARDAIEVSALPEMLAKRVTDYLAMHYEQAK